MALSALTAGYGAPVAAAWLADSPAGLSGNSALQSLMALAIGVACPTLVPVVLGWAKRKVEAQ